MTKRSRKRSALLAVAAVAILVAVFHDRIGPDFWPPDSSRIGPNLLAALVQAVLVLIILVLLYPPWRRAVHRFVDNKLVKVHDKLDSHARHVAQLHDRHDQHDANHEHVRTSLAALAEQLATLQEAVVGSAKSPASKPSQTKPAATKPARRTK